MKLMKCFLWIRGVWIAIENLGVNRKLMWEIYINGIPKLKNLFIEGKEVPYWTKGSSRPDYYKKPDIV